MKPIRNQVHKKFKYRIVSFVMLLALMLLMASPAYAIIAKVEDVTEVDFYEDGSVKSITIQFQAEVENFAPADGRIFLHTSESSYSWDNRVKISSDGQWDSLETLSAIDTSLAAVSEPDFRWTDCELHTVTAYFEKGATKDNTTYYVYLWTKQPSDSSWCPNWQYPDYKFSDTISVSNGCVKFGEKTFVPESTPDLPVTGDAFPLTFFGILVILSAVGAATMLRVNKHRA